MSRRDSFCKASKKRPPSYESGRFSFLLSKDRAFYFALTGKVNVLFPVDLELYM